MTEPDEPTTKPDDPGWTRPALPTWEDWRTGTDAGAQAAHLDAGLAPDERMTWADVEAEGPAYWSGYSTHWNALLSAGVVRVS